MHFMHSMRPTRPIHVRNAAIAVAGIGALAAFAVLPPTAGAATTPSAQAEYQAAIKAAGTQGVHFASSATQGGVSIEVDGDTGVTSGAQTLTVKKGSLAEHVSAKVVGSTGYVQGNATALQNVIGLTKAQSKKYAGTWLSFPTSNSALGELVSGLLNSQVTTELQMSGPYSYGSATTVQGQHVEAVRGSVSTQSGSKVPVVLYVPSSGSPVPIEEVTNPGKTGGSTAIHGVVVFTKWGEKTSESAPGTSVSLLKLVPATTSGATTTTTAG
jgi:hypothetical protein